MTYKFTDEQIQYIIDNWGKESAHSMKKKFGCTWYAVVGVAKKNNLELPVSEKWTDEEVETLKELSTKFHYSKIAKKMGRTENAICLKARRLDIVLIQDRRKWLSEEEDLFEKLWGHTSIEAISRQLKRSIFSLKVKAVRMGIGSMMSNNVEAITISNIEDMLKVTRDRIMSWQEKGLNIKQKRVTRNMSYYYVNFDELLIFLEKNKDLWDSRLVEPYMLGEESEWLLEKRKNDRNSKPHFYKHWTKEEEKQILFMRRMGKNYSEIAKELNRTEGSVKERLRDLLADQPFYKTTKQKQLGLKNFQD